MEREHPGPYPERICNILVYDTVIQDEDSMIVYHKVIKIQLDGTIESGFRVFERLIHPWESDPEMKRLA